MLAIHTQHVYCSHIVLNSIFQVAQRRCPRESLNTASVVAVSLQVTTGRSSLKLGLQDFHMKTVVHTTAQTMEELIRMVMYVPLLCPRSVPWHMLIISGQKHKEVLIVFTTFVLCVHIATHLRMMISLHLQRYAKARIRRVLQTSLSVISISDAFSCSSANVA
jgi:Na+/H+-dicarboxylate symporter